MKRSVKKLVSVLIFLMTAGLSNLIAEINVINPVKGVWANKQMLVIDTSEGGEFYYSVDGSNPANFGFFYDRPVLLDVEGDVNLKISHVRPDGRDETVEVRYSVNTDRAENKPYSDFISTFYDTGLVNYTSGTVFSIPAEMNFKMNNSTEFMHGIDLSISEKNVLSRYVPCVVRPAEGGKSWRFIIKTFPHVAGLNNTRKVPIKIEDWETVVFTDKNLLYKIDDEYWSMPLENRHIDRSRPHIVSWQNVDFQKGSAIDFCILPAKPKIKTMLERDGTTSFVVEGDSSYTMSVKGDNNRYSELYSQLGADVFYGDNAEGLLKVGLFSSSVYQGEISVSYNIDKRAPEVPKISSDFEGFYSRRNVRLGVETDSKNKLFIAVSRPLLIKDVTKLNDEVINALKQTSVGNFKEYKPNGYQNEFLPNDAGALFYKIQAYSQNEITKSQTVEYSFIIDSYNYFFDSESSGKNADGSAAHPYNNIKECLEDINSCTSVKLRLKGNAEFPPEAIRLVSDCEILNDGNATLIFNEGSSIQIDKSTLSLNNIRIQKEKVLSENDLIPLFSLNNGTLELKNCELSADFAKNGTVIDASSGVVKVFDSIASVNAVTYSSFISSMNSYLILRDSVINTSADTSVVISATKGNVDSISNQFKVSAKTGRIAELFGAKGDFEKNVFKCDLPQNQNSDGFVMVFANKDSVLKELDNSDYAD
ncbi:FN3 associated domain-containing protein [Treponema sp. C6A8]|uniref:FN3 associated domain-containing protein n=1 Tax=Treponema sp. C6A8 TaxID=1410609 RepID=UPI0004864950|nr:FN3 associated domain-containing protein [Treponema sp. C6A8]